MLEIFKVIYPIFGIIFLGFLSVYLQLIAKEQLKILSIFVIRVGLPCILIVNIPAQKISDLWQPQYLISYGLASIALFIPLLFLYYRKFNEPLNRAAVYAMGGSMSNTGFIGGAILHLILGPTAAIYFAMTFLVENFIVFLLFLICLEISQQRNTKNLEVILQTLKSIVKNPIIIGLTLGTALCIVGIQLPESLLKTLEPIGKTAGPLGLFVVGGSLYGITTLKNTGRDLVIIFISKMILMPILVYLLFLYMPNTNQEMIFSGVLLSSISMVTMFSVFGQSFDMSEKTSAILLLCTVANLLTVTTVIALLMPT